MDQDFFESKLDYHLFLHTQLATQVTGIQKIVQAHKIDSFEAMLGNELVRDVLLLKFIILQRTLKKVGTYILENRYRINLRYLPWLECEYFDQYCAIHYDCVWLFLQNIKSFKKQIERIKKYENDKNNTEYGEDVRCSFCGKSQDEIKRMITGPHEAICDECVQICSEILADDAPDKKTNPQ